jgi:hypothetical protein
VTPPKGKTASYVVCDADKSGRPIVDLHYPPGRVAHPGDVVDDIPPSSVKWLLRDGLIRESD